MGIICSCIAGSACAVRRCCSSAVHGVYAVARNGLWEDPAEATNGTVFKRFEKEAQKSGLGKEIPPYLTWRYCYLQCSAFFAVLQQVLTAEDLNPDRALYDDLLAEVPPGLELSRFDTLILILAWWNFALTIVWFISFILLVAAILSARPSQAVRRVGLSRKLTWASWLVNFSVPFALFLVFPLRSVVNWSGLEVDVCAVAVHGTLQMQGVDMGSSMVVLQQRGLLTPGAEQLALTGSTSAEVAREWCKEHGSDWSNIFFDGAVQCVFDAESSCRQSVCTSAPSNVQRLCLSQCLNFTGRAEEAGSPGAGAFLDSLTQCPSATGRGTSGGGILQMPALSGGQGQSVDFNSSDSLQAFNYTANNQRVGAAQSRESAQMIIDRLQYIVGLYLAFRAGQLLLSAALSVLGGLAEALVNLKALFPGSQEPNWVLILTTFQGVPIYCCMMAFAQQMIGDHWLGIACALFAAFSSLSGVTAMSSLMLREGVTERWVFYRKVWIEYGLRFLFGLGASASLWAFLQVNFPELEELLQVETALGVMTITLLSYLARKSLIAVAGTDAALSAFVQCELWHDNAPKEDQERLRATLSSMGGLLAPVLCRQASAELGLRRRVGQQDTADAPKTDAQAADVHMTDV